MSPADRMGVLEQRVSALEQRNCTLADAIGEGDDLTPDERAEARRSAGIGED